MKDYYKDYYEEAKSLYSYNWTCTDKDKWLATFRWMSEDDPAALEDYWEKLKDYLRTFESEDAVYEIQHNCCCTAEEAKHIFDAIAKEAAQEVDWDIEREYTDEADRDQETWYGIRKRLRSLTDDIKKAATRVARKNDEIYSIRELTEHLDLYLDGWCPDDYDHDDEDEVQEAEERRAAYREMFTGGKITDSSWWSRCTLYGVDFLVLWVDC